MEIVSKEYVFVSDGPNSVFLKTLFGPDFLRHTNHVFFLIWLFINWMIISISNKPFNCCPDSLFIIHTGIRSATGIYLFCALVNHCINFLFCLSIFILLFISIFLFIFYNYEEQPNHNHVQSYSSFLSLLIASVLDLSQTTGLVSPSSLMTSAAKYQ